MVALETRAPVAALLQMGVKKTLDDKDETLIAVLADITNEGRAEFSTTQHGSPLVLVSQLSFAHVTITKISKGKIVLRFG